MIYEIYRNIERKKERERKKTEAIINATKLNLAKDENEKHQTVQPSDRSTND